MNGTPTRTRCQQDALYAAERVVRPGRFFDTLEEVQRYVDGLRENAWWREVYPGVVYVEVGRADHRGTASVGWFEEDQNAGRMEFLDCHRSELNVLHELAHVLAQARWGSRSHDPGFARTYLELVYRVMGSDAYLELWSSFEEHGIEHGG